MAKKIKISVRSFPEMDASVLEMLAGCGDRIVMKDGTVYRIAGDNVYSCEDSPEGKTLLSQIQPIKTNSSSADSEEEALKAALRGQADLPLLSGFGLKDRAKRCAILLHLSQHTEISFLRELIPLDGKDRIVMTDNGNAVILVNTDRKTENEIREFAAAAAETVENEAGINCFAGIGRITESIADISGSYSDAETAISIGIRYRIPGRVFSFSELTLERLTDAIPDEEASELKKEIIPDRCEKLFTEDILETIRAFFLNDLNLSTTARQLYIHRNTLIYRMEKIRKVTGLDLRKFEDAVIFRILMSISDKQG